MKVFISISCLVFYLFSLTYSQTYVYPSVNAQVETPTAVNPTNSNNLIAGAILQQPGLTNGIGCYFSTNGGNSWTAYENFTGPDNTSAGDPVVVFDPDGIAYFFYQVKTEGAFYMRKSTDGGQTWEPSLTSTGTKIIYVESPGIIDRPSFAISPVRNNNGSFNIYVACTSYSGGSEYITLYINDTGGINFYSIYKVKPPQNYGYSGTSVAVGPSGELFLSWGQELIPKIPVTSIIVQRSTDQGRTFNNQITVNINQIGQYNGNDDNYYVKQFSIRADSYPRLFVDQSPNHPGSIYAVWAGCSVQYGLTSNVYMLKGTVTNGQFSWGNVSTIASESSLQWSPAVTVNNDGVVSISYYSSDTSPTGLIYTNIPR